MNTVRELMTSRPTVIAPEESALAALDLMIDGGIRHLPVVSKERLLGVLSLDDLRAALPFAVSLRRPPNVEEREFARDLVVSDVMTHAPLTTRPEARVADAAATLARFRIGCLPVLDGTGALVGILSETDVLRSLAGGAVQKQSDAAKARSYELELLVAELRAERARIARRLGRVQEVEREVIASEREIPMDPVELASHVVELSVDEPLAALAARRLDALDHALFRAQQGRLGTCEKCGGEIPVTRLRALPGSTSCVRCARGAT